VRDDGATDETLAAPSSTGPTLAQGTTRGSAPTMNANPVPAGQQTRASSPSLAETRAADPAPELPVVDRANYQIIRELARGGMGRILEAIDLRLDRPIALKEVLHGDDGARARFDREVRITARLQHPAIVHVTEAGQWPDGQPFFAMKLIRGKPLDARIAETATLSERLALIPAVIAVTDALAYAHSKSVIHRDLKPANVLVGDFGETVVIDWGIAKDLTDTEAIVSLDPDRPSTRTLSGSGAETVEGSVMGTPSYMPPEQANGDRVDARADVYALGAMLYQVLAGVPPFVGRTTAEVLAKVIDGSPEPLATLVPDAPVDLIAVVEKAMARSPDARFPTAHEMVVELKRFQQGKLVASHAYTTWQLIARWVRRNRAAVVVGAAALATLLVLGTFGLMKIVEERRRTELEATTARAQADLGVISRARVALATDPTEAVALLKQLSPDTTQVRAARMIAADAATAGVAHVLVGGGAIDKLAFSPDGRFLASYELPGDTIRIWDVATYTGRPIGGASYLLDLALTADSVIAFDADGRLYRWPSDAATPVPPTLIRTIPGAYRGAWFSPDGRRVIVAAIEGAAESSPHLILKMVELADPSGVARVIGESRGVAWAPDSRSFMSLDMSTKTLLRLDAATGELLDKHDGVYPIAFATDGKQTWVSGNKFRGDETRILRNLTTRAAVPIDFEMFGLHPTRDGRLVGTTSRAAQRVMTETLHGSHKGSWIPFDVDDLTTGEHALLVSDGWPGSSIRLRGHTATVDAIAVSSANLIASGDSGGAIRLWTLPVVRRDHGDGHTTATYGALTSTGELLITRRGPRLELRDPHTGTSRLLEVTEVAPGIERDLERPIERSTRIGTRFIRESAIGPDDEVIELVRAADGRHLATVDSQAHVVVWDLATGRGKLLADHVIHVAIDRDGSHVVTSRTDGDRGQRLVERWNVATGAATVLSDQLNPTAILFAGDRAVIANLDQSIYVVEGDALHRLAMPELGYRTLAATADGDTLYAGSDSWVIVEHRLSTKTNRLMRGHTGTIIGLVVDPAGKRVFSTAADHTIRMWQADTLTSVVLRGHTGLVTSMELGVDDTLITAATDLTSRIWDLKTLDSRALEGHEDRPVFAAHVAGGQHVVVVDRFHQLAWYPDNLPADQHLLRAWLDAATNLGARAD